LSCLADATNELDGLVAETCLKLDAAFGLKCAMKCHCFDPSDNSNLKTQSETVNNSVAIKFCTHYEKTASNQG
jgi:hypothetical protein